MRTQPVTPALWQRNEDGLPWSAEFNDIYHPASGAFAQAEHVFIAGNGLQQRWRGRERFVILETGFGLGNSFLATWQAWRADARACERLHFISIEKHPLRLADLRDAHATSPLPELAGALIAAWPPLTPNLHRLDFDDGRVQLSLAFGDVEDWLRELIAEVDAFYLDGFAPARNPRMWQPRVFKAMARLATPGATVATWTAARAVREGLTSAGFETRLAAGRGGKRDITLARYAPAFTPRRSPPRFQSPADTRHAIVIGAGLAGCATAWALAEQGWSTTLVDRREAPALETSGNPAGLFHGTVHPQDGPHARFNRAASFHIAEAARIAIAHHSAAGQVGGLIRLTDGTLELAAMRALLEAQGLPQDYVSALDRREASTACGLTVEHPAWLYPGGGWISPSALARSFLERTGSRVTLISGVEIAGLTQAEDGWRLTDADQRTVIAGQTIVLANAADAVRLISAFDGSTWPVESVRGQISIAPIPDSLPLPSMPVAGHGYLIPNVGGDMVFGATSRTNDPDADVRTSDHLQNLAQLARLYGHAWTGSPVPLASLRGRVGWRSVARDRLPLIGGVPNHAAMSTSTSLSLSSSASTSSRFDKPGDVPRWKGLFMFAALGSRGISWAPIGARIVASAITGSPCAVEASLLDAVDAGRYAARHARMAGSSASRTSPVESEGSNDDSQLAPSTGMIGCSGNRHPDDGSREK